jgi:hypothetical protein
MVRRRSTLILAGWFASGILVWLASPALGRETEEQLVQRIQSEQNPVKKARDQMKLAELKLEQAEDAYSKGEMELGAKLVEVFTKQMQASWQTLRDSGRKAAKQPQGFKELDIALREKSRALEDLGRKVSYFDRGPIEKAGKEMDRIRAEVLQALFPAAKPHPANPPASPPHFVRPGSGSEMW